MCGKPLPKMKAITPLESPVEPKPEVILTSVEPPAVQPESSSAKVDLAAAPTSQPAPSPKLESEAAKPVVTPVAPGTAQPTITPQPVIKPLTTSAAAAPSSFTPQPLPMARGRKRPLPTQLIFGVVLVFVVVLAVFGIPYANGETDGTVVAAAATNTLSVIPTFTPTITLIPTETTVPTAEPTVTLTPAPTATLQPPQSHVVQAGETLFTLSFRYNVTADSIAELNGMGDNANIIIDQTLLVPWPTATPPLEPVLVEIDGQYFAADASDCADPYTIQDGDSLVGIGNQQGVDFRVIIAANRLTETSIIQPGDTLCLPRVEFLGSEQPPTPGPTSTPGPTPIPEGPQLLYPIDETAITDSEAIIALQWVTVIDLLPDEWYMVEIIDLTDVNSHPRRAFTRHTSFQLPGEWHPLDNLAHRFQWRVTIVNVSGRRQDGGFIYAPIGNSSRLEHFTWQNEP